MGAIKETTVHDMKTHFSQYAAELLAGEYDEIVVKNRTTPTLRITKYENRTNQGIKLGLAAELGHPTVPDDWDINEGDEEIIAMFDKDFFE